MVTCRTLGLEFFEILDPFQEHIGLWPIQNKSGVFGDVGLSVLNAAAYWRARR
jgi:hypothetical protein